MPDLWPDDIATVPESKAPASILKEQASLLGMKTNNLVQAEVVRYEPGIGESEKFKHGFLIKAETLDNYRYRLFTIKHGITLYPVYISLDKDIQQEVASTLVAEDVAVKCESELVDILGKILKAKKTKQVIRSLLALIEAEAGEDGPCLPF